MTKNEKLISAMKKIEQYEHQKSKQNNHAKAEKDTVDLRRQTLVGKIFLNHFPIALEFTPGKSDEEDEQNFKPLDDFMESLAKCQQCYREIEDALLQSR